MRLPTLPAIGRCRCAATQFEITAPPIMTLACHCRDCQRMSASAFSLGAMIPAHGFKITAGTPVARPLPRSPRHHHFCPVCMTLIFTRIDGVDTRVNLRATLLDDASWVAPFIETMTRDRLPWAKTPALHAFDGFPAAEAFPGLLVAFAEWIEPG